MSEITKDVRLRVIAESKAYAQGMAEIPGITQREAAKAAALYAKEMTKAEAATIASFRKQAAAAERVSDAAVSGGAGVKKLGDIAGGTGQSMARLAGALDLIAPGTGEAARAIADFADVGEVAAAGGKAMGLSNTALLATLGPLAVGLAALGGAWWYYSQQLEKAEEAQAKAAAAASNQQGLHERLAAVADEVGDAYRLATGEVDQQGLALEAHRAKIDEVVGAQRRLLDEQYAAQLAAGEDAELTLHQIAALERRRAELGREAEAVAESGRQQDRARDAARGLAEADREAAQAAAQRTAALERQLAAGQAAMAEDTSRLQAALSGVERLHAAERDAMDARLTGAAAAQAAVDAQLVGLEAVYQATVATADTDAARLAALDAYTRARTEITQTGAQQVQAVLDQELAATLAGEREKRSQYRQTQDYIVGSLSGAVGSFADLAEAAAEKGGAAGEQAAAFAQAAAIFQAGVDTRAAVVAGLDLPPGLRAANTAFVLAAGAAEIAQIRNAKKPTYDAGGAVAAAPDQVDAQLRANEYVLTPHGRSLIGDSTLQAANRGEAPSQAPIIFSAILGAKAFDAQVARHLQHPDSALVRHLAGTSRVGRR